MSDRALCEHYAVQVAQLDAAGTPIGRNDLWIAAHAWAERATLLTHKLRAFALVKRLATEDWAA